MSKPVFRLTYEEAKVLNPCSLDKIPEFGRRKYMTPQLAFDAYAAAYAAEPLRWIDVFNEAIAK